MASFVIEGSTVMWDLKFSLEMRYFARIAAGWNRGHMGVELPFFVFLFLPINSLLQNGVIFLILAGFFFVEQLEWSWASSMLLAILA